MDTAGLTGTWEIDPGHTRIGFATRHAMVTKVRGAFNDVSGRIEVDPADPDASTATVTVAMASIDTRNAQRDEHLRSADFFDVETYPEMTFTSTRIEEVDDDAYMVTGDLTIRDLTRSIGIPLRFVGIDTDPFGNVRAGVEGTRRLDRRDWGITWNTPLDSGGLLVGDRIQLVLALSLIPRGCGGGARPPPTESRAARARAGLSPGALSDPRAPRAGPRAPPRGAPACRRRARRR
jgi:polyisoprenoid-binding protein YceI